jgi:CHAT domain-containing protein
MNIPFEVLAMNERGTDRLLQHYACQYSYSAATLWHSQTKAKSVRYATETVCIAPIHFQQYNKVDLVQSEALMRALSIRANTILQEKQATKANFMHHAPKARILQLITHGEAYTERGEPCIFLSDSILWLSELEKQPIDAQLAVLTACESNAGKAAKGEGVLSWAYSFAKAGVPATVASLWSADEAAAMEITQLFHQYLAKGWTKSRALQQAKLDFLEGDMNNYPPNLWANFIMYGEDAPVGNSSFPPHYYWLAFGGLLSVLLGIKMVRLKSRGKVYN